MKNIKAQYKSKLAWLVLLIMLISSCVTTSQTHVKKNRSNRHVSTNSRLTPDTRNRLVTVAKKALGKNKLTVNGKKYKSDCSGIINAIFSAANVGISINGGVKNIYRHTKKYGQIVKNKPAPGDLIFFHNTYDKSRNGKINDWLTHIGIVEKIEPDNTIHFIHFMGYSVVRSYLNLSSPKLSYHPQTNKRINHYLRRAQGPYRAYTAAELFAGFGKL